MTGILAHLMSAMGGLALGDQEAAALATGAGAEGGTGAGAGEGTGAGAQEVWGQIQWQ